MTDKTSLIEFPCHFPIKIIGTNTALFAQEIAEIARRHFPDLAEDAIGCQESQKGNYLSITVTVFVSNQQMLDALYQDLTGHPDIKMVL
ncbi:MAG: DUF493 domain-containing protein [Tatlockia sp.]|jgi:hypothetical protein